MHNGACEADEVQVEAATRHADVPYGLNGEATQHDQKKENGVLDDEKNDADPSGQLEPAGGEDAGVKGQGGDLDQELDEGINLLADPVVLRAQLYEHRVADVTSGQKEYAPAKEGWHWQDPHSKRADQSREKYLMTTSEHE